MRPIKPDDEQSLGPALQDARFAVAAITAAALIETGDVLRHQRESGDQTALGLSMIASMAGERSVSVTAST